MIVYHTQVQLSIINGRSNMHSCKHPFICRNYKYRSKWTRGLIFRMKNLPRNQLRHCNVPPNHRPACSSVSQQHCHPELGMIPQGLRVNCRFTHNQGDAISKPNTAGFDRPSTIGQASTVRTPTTTYRSNTIPSQPCEEGKTTRDNPQPTGETRL